MSITQLKSNTIYSTKAQITDVKLDRSGKVFVKVAVDGEELIGPAKIKDPEVEKKQQVDLKNINSIKLIKAVGGSKESPVLAVLPKSAHLISNSGKNGFSVIQDSGSFINGPITFDAHPESIRIWNIYRLNGELTSTMPSTIITPIPMLKLDFPISGVKELKNILNEIKSLLS